MNLDPILLTFKEPVLAQYYLSTGPVLAQILFKPVSSNLVTVVRYFLARQEIGYIAFFRTKTFSHTRIDTS